MSEAPVNPTSPEENEYYFFVLDGEVVWRHSIPITDGLEGVHAIFSSNPTVVKCPAELKETVQYGWTWDGTNFSAPTE
jgi:hypothetical protein